MANQSPSEQISNLAARMGELVDGVKQINSTINGPTGLIVQVELLKRDVSDSEDSQRTFAESTRKSVDILTEVLRGNGKPGLLQRVDKTEHVLQAHEEFVGNIKSLMWKIVGIGLTAGGVGSAVVSAITQAVGNNKSP